MISIHAYLRVYLNYLSKDSKREKDYNSINKPVVLKNKCEVVSDVTDRFRLPEKDQEKTVELIVDHH